MLGCPYIVGRSHVSQRYGNASRFLEVGGPVRGFANETCLSPSVVRLYGSEIASVVVGAYYSFYDIGM